MRALTLEERKKAVTTELRMLMNSCVEGYTGEWERDTAGFVAMYESLLTIARALGVVVKGVKRGIVV